MNLETARPYSFILFCAIHFLSLTAIFSSGELKLPLERTSPLSIAILPDLDSVVIGDPVLIRCQVDKTAPNGDIMSRSSMYLYCPLVKDDFFCFQNCHSICEKESAGNCVSAHQLARVSCRSEVSLRGIVTYEYTIPILTRSWLEEGTGFACSSAGERTEVKNLRTRAVIPSAHPANASTPLIRTPAMLGRDEPPIREAKSTLFLLTRELMIGIFLVGVFCSVMLNIFYCIRCILIRQYSKSNSPVLMKGFFCMREEIDNARIVRKTKLLKQEEDKSRGDPRFRYHPIFDGMAMNVCPLLGEAPHLEQAQSEESLDFDRGIKRDLPEGKATNSRKSGSGVSLSQIPLKLFTSNGQQVIVTTNWPGSEYAISGSLKRNSAGILIPANYYQQASHFSHTAENYPSGYSLRKSPNTTPRRLSNINVTSMENSMHQGVSSAGVRLSSMSSQDTILTGNISQAQQSLLAKQVQRNGSFISEVHSDLTNDTGALKQPSIRETIENPQALSIRYVLQETGVPKFIGVHPCADQQVWPLLFSQHNDTTFETGMNGCAERSLNRALPIEETAGTAYFLAKDNLQNGVNIEMRNGTDAAIEQTGADTRSVVQNGGRALSSCQVRHWLEKCENPELPKQTALVSPDFSSELNGDLEGIENESLNLPNQQTA